MERIQFAIRQRVEQAQKEMVFVTDQFRAKYIIDKNIEIDRQTDEMPPLAEAEMKIAFLL